MSWNPLWLKFQKLNRLREEGKKALLIPDDLCPLATKIEHEGVHTLVGKFCYEILNVQNYMKEIGV